MEGLIPFVYKAIMQNKGGKEDTLGSWISESPSYSYIRLPSGDSGRFQNPSPPTSNPASSATQIIVSSGVQSPHQCLTHLLIQAQGLASIIYESLCHDQATSSPLLTKSAQPPHEFVALNVDNSSLGNPGVVGFRGVVRDDRGK
ncbi:hypothetical protein RJT34_15770 [Clitoria ternatea]|uniref:Uncharacterized protein n=1 Tax=Clitoria ternatea TaxID=43366 RepID=A0AAN9J923_CLITE